MGVQKSLHLAIGCGKIRQLVPIKGTGKPMSAITMKHTAMTATRTRRFNNVAVCAWLLPSGSAPVGGSGI